MWMVVKYAHIKYLLFDTSHVIRLGTMTWAVANYVCKQMYYFCWMYYNYEFNDI